jgi:two-component system sensor histidine kinase KdpD
LALVDELAHTNAPGSRHPKRYMDVEELLAAGIDVYTTLNIQHVESLNDVIAQITRVRVRETVPDSVIDHADNIEVIDLTPEDLIQRLKEGKVYIEGQAQKAIANFFSTGNLTALRELALRRTAERVDVQMLDYMRSRAIDGPWAANERLLVCINEGPNAHILVRHARRMADRLHAPWSVIHVEVPRWRPQSDAGRDQVAEALRLAQRLGAETVSLPGENIAETILDYARVHNFTHLVTGRSQDVFWQTLFGLSTTQKLIRRADGINIHVLAQQKSALPQAKAAGSAKSARQIHKSRRLDFKPYLGSLGIVGAALLLALGLRQVLAVSNISLAFLVAVLVSAVTSGLGPSLWTCLVSVVAYNFFFLPPLYTFTIADPENVVALFFFAIVAVIASQLAARVRGQAIAARHRAKIAEELYLFSRKLAGAVTLDDLLWATAYQIASMLKVRVVLLLPENGFLEVVAGFPPEDQIDESDRAAAHWCFDKGLPAGRGADTLPGAKWLFLPMRTGRGTIGVIGVDHDREDQILRPEENRLLDALSDQAALAIERIHLAGAIERGKREKEADRLRSALLTSISHDLRTPLAAILGSASSLATQRDVLQKDVQTALLRTIQDEAERLNRFIGNLLDMTRLEAGPLEPNSASCDLSDLIGATLERAAKVLSNHKIEIALAPDLPMVRLDMVLMEQVLFNLLDNAAKYAPQGSLIRIGARQENDIVVLEVEDEGNGLPPEDFERVFDKFYRVRSTDRQRAGTGLGLAICRGFVEAMGGTIVARNRASGHGARFVITLPVPAFAGLDELDHER